MKAPICSYDNNFEYNLILPYFIVAPYDDFNKENTITIGNEIFYNYKPRFKDSLVRSRQRKIEDPVILKPFKIKGVTLLAIVTKWGNEAEIPEFQNPTLEN